MSDQVRRALKDLMGASPTAWVDVDVIKAHIAALEKERDEAWAERAKMCAEKHAALADNAALLEAHQNIRDTWMGPFAGTADARMRATLRTGESVLEVAHPGAALLEEHRKALEQRDAAMKLSAMTQQTVEMLNARIDQDDRDHAKALVRARNEGLEKAAEHLRGTTPDAARLRREILAMKEPEE